MATANVVTGKNRRVIGIIELNEGVRTNRGRVVRITPGGTVVTEEGSFRNTSTLNVMLTDARRHGYSEPAELATA